MIQPVRCLDIPNVDLLSWTFGNPTYDQDKPIYVDSQDDSKSISRRQARSYIRKLISGLHARGLETGDSVCLHSFNNLYYSSIYLATVGAGGCFTGSNPAYTTFELKHLFSMTKAKFVIVEPELFENILPAVKECGIPLSNVFIFNTHDQDIPDCFESWEALLQHGETDWHVFDDEKKAKNTTAALVSTSGTTGLPKAASISHYAHVAQNVTLYDSREKPYKVLRLLCLPQFHAFAAPLSHVAPLREGHTTYIMKRFDLGQFVECFNRYGITETTIVTPIVMAILALPQDQRVRLASLRYAWCGGAPLDGSIQNQFNESLHPDAIVSQVWGLSEIGWITTFHYPEKDQLGSVGRLLPNMEAKIVDEDLNELGENGQGEILIRGPSIMNSYLDAPEATKKTVVDGWLHTGDIGYQRGGKWYIIDRAKELIKVRGWQVSPTELEICLLKHPSIIDAAVIGVDLSDGRGELPRAYLVLDPTSLPPVTDEEIQKHVHCHLAKYKALTGGIRHIKVVPRSAAGKILKKVLRKEIEEEVREHSKMEVLTNGH